MPRNKQKDRLQYPRYQASQFLSDLGPTELSFWFIPKSTESCMGLEGREEPSNKGRSGAMQGVAAMREVWEGGARQPQRATREGVRQHSEGWDNTEKGWGNAGVKYDTGGTRATWESRAEDGAADWGRKRGMGEGFLS